MSSTFSCPHWQCWASNLSQSAEGLSRYSHQEECSDGMPWNLSLQNRLSHTVPNCPVWLLPTPQPGLHGSWLSELLRASCRPSTGSDLCILTHYRTLWKSLSNWNWLIQHIFLLECTLASHVTSGIFSFILRCWICWHKVINNIPIFVF